MILQIIGKPGSGKTYLINKFKNDILFKDWYFTDIATYSYQLFNSIDRDHYIINEIISNINKNIICESACGIHQLKDIAQQHRKQHTVIQLGCNYKTTIHNHIQRNESIDNDKLEYYGYLEALMLKYNYYYDTSNHDNINKIFSDIKYKLLK